MERITRDDWLMMSNEEKFQYLAGGLAEVMEALVYFADAMEATNKTIGKIVEVMKAAAVNTEFNSLFYIDKDGKLQTRGE